MDSTLKPLPAISPVTKTAHLSAHWKHLTENYGEQKKIKKTSSMMAEISHQSQRPNNGREQWQCPCVVTEAGGYCARGWAILARRCPSPGAAGHHKSSLSLSLSDEDKVSLRSGAVGWYTAVRCLGLHVVGNVLTKPFRCCFTYKLLVFN